MLTRAITIALLGWLVLSSGSVFADTVKSCNAHQQINCARFCKHHEGMKSCKIDVTQRDGTCVCADNTSHTKSK